MIQPKLRTFLIQLTSGFRFIVLLATLVAHPSRYGTFMLIARESRFDGGFRRSYSQHAEDLILEHFLKNEHTKTYIDVGCNHPSRFSNTRLLYENGWSGINIDANNNFADEYQKMRPRDAFVHGLVGNRDGSVDFFVFEESALSTMKPEVADEYLRAGWTLARVESLPTIRLSDIVLRHFHACEVTLLSVDCEGGDLDVQKSADLSNLKPKWILVETPLISIHGVEVEDQVSMFLLSHDYSKVCQLPQSTLFARRTQ